MRRTRLHFSPVSQLNQDESFISDAEGQGLSKNIEEGEESSVETALIRITHSVRIRWDLLMMVLAIYNALTVPFFVAFYIEENLTLFTVNTAIDCIFIVDIALNFYTTYIDRNGDEVTEHRKVVTRYLKGYFWIDLVASMPIDNFYLRFGDVQEDSEFIQLSDLLKLNRILRLSRIIRLMRAREDVKGFAKLLQLTLYLVVWVHLTGCIWFLIVKSEQK